jgi:hypothetical protein
VIIWGWGRTTVKDYGLAAHARCPHCNNEVDWHLIHRRVWFTLFFIPIIPYRSNFLLLCPICRNGIEISGQQIEAAKRQIAELTALTAGGTAPKGLSQ